MSTVEMSLQASHLSAAMAEMRIWLDERRFEPASFSCREDSAGVVIRVDFAVTTEAEAFAGRFRGYIGSPPAESGDGRGRGQTPHQPAKGGALGQGQG
jgi:hypothetical protein